jgi:HK97 family phage major capsid protein
MSETIVNDGELLLKGREAEEFKSFMAERAKSEEAKRFEALAKNEIAKLMSENQKEEKKERKPVFEKYQDVPMHLKAKAFQKQVKGMFSKNKDQYLEGLNEANLLMRTGEAMDVGTSAEGGYGVTPIFYQDTIQKAMDESAVADADVIPISTNQLYSTEFLTGVSVADSSELGTPAHTMVTLDQFNLSTKQTRASTVISKELMEDAPQLLAVVQKSYQEALKTKFNQIIFTDATGSSKNFNGALAETVTLNTTTGGCPVKYLSGAHDSVTNQFLTQVVHSLSPEDWSGAKWYFNDAWSEALESLVVDGTQRPLLFDPMGGVPTQMKGFPIRRVTDMPNATTLTAAQLFAAFGNLSTTCHLWMRTSAEFAVIREGTVNGVNCGEQGAMGLVMFMRYAYKVYVRRFNDGRRTGLTLIGRS